MKKVRMPAGLLRRGRLPILGLLVIFSITLAVGLRPATMAVKQSLRAAAQSDAIPPVEFSRIVGEWSEEEGYFRSDNFVSNETSYLHILDKMKSLGAVGGAYIGVGPEQNFTYISRIRPRIAFIVDIRRQAVIQHLMYKALFHHSPDRAQFLSNLFSKPLGGKEAPGPSASLEELVAYFESAPTDIKLFLKNLDLIARSIREDFRIALDSRDVATLEYVYDVFRSRNLNLQYRSYSQYRSTRWGYFPTLRELMLERDLQGRMRNFLASPEDYDFLRDLHMQNRIIPVVGDFAGGKALAAVAQYLRKNDYTVTAFYTSNVEQYLFANGVFPQFAENVKKLPLSEKSLFIRAFSSRRTPHPAHATGHRLTTLLEKIEVFLKDYDEGHYPDYWSLVTTNYISGK